jgi:hypothetical protein
MAASIAVLSSLFFKGAITALNFLVSSDIPDFMLNLPSESYSPYADNAKPSSGNANGADVPLNAITERGEHLLRIVQAANCIPTIDTHQSSFGNDSPVRMEMTPA